MAVLASIGVKSELQIGSRGMKATVRTIVRGTIAIRLNRRGVLGGTVGVVGTLYPSVSVSGLATLWILLRPAAKNKNAA